MMGGADKFTYLKEIFNLHHLNTPLNLYSVAPNTRKSSDLMAKADSGCSAHFLKDEHKPVLCNLQQLKNGPVAKLPDKSTIKASHSGLLAFKFVTDKAKQSLIYPHLTNESLLSMGQFCDDDCIAVFTKTNVYVIKDNDLVLHGRHNFKDRLWDVRLPSSSNITPSHSTPTSSSINYIIRKDKSTSDISILSC